MAQSELTSRVLVGLVGIPAGLAVVYYGGWVLGAVLTLVAVLVALEFFRLAEQKQVRPLAYTGAVTAALFIVLATLRPEAGPSQSGFMTLLVLSVIAVATVGIWTRGVAGQPLLSASVTVMGAVYSGALLSFAVFLRHLPDLDGPTHGAALLAAPLVLTWASDTFAYASGRLFGRHKLIPSVSPGKTVQGAAGAVIGTALVAVAYSIFLSSFSTYRITVAEAIVFGIVLSVAAQVGDLAESLFKRDAGVKDSGTLLPGHGGALDRFDSLLFTLPLGYFFFRFFVGPGPF